MAFGKNSSLAACPCAKEPITLLVLHMNIKPLTSALTAFTANSTIFNSFNREIKNFPRTQLIGFQLTSQFWVVRKIQPKHQW